MSRFLVHKVEVSVLALIVGASLGFMWNPRGIHFAGPIAFGWLALLLANLVLWLSVMIVGTVMLVARRWRLIVGAPAGPRRPDERSTPMIFSPMVVHERLMAG